MENLKNEHRTKLKDIDFLDLFFTRVENTGYLEKAVTKEQLYVTLKDYEKLIEKVENCYKNLYKYAELLESKPMTDDNNIAIKKIYAYMLNKNDNNTAYKKIKVK